MLDAHLFHFTEQIKNSLTNVQWLFANVEKKIEREKEKENEK